jgi:hypothetical protein
MLNLYLVRHGDHTFLVRASNVDEAMQIVNDQLPGRSRDCRQEDVEEVEITGEPEIVEHFLE